MAMGASSAEGPWIGTDEAAARLGVKRQTLYAYVSRGLLTSRRGPGNAGSTYRLSDIEALGERGTRPTASASRPFRFPVLTTAISDVGPGRLAYRGYDVAALADSSTFEAVCSLLWTGVLSDEHVDEQPDIGPISAGLAGLPAHLPTSTRLRIGVALLSAYDPWRMDLSPTGVRRTARRALSGMVGLLAPAGTSPGPLAAQLWPALAARPPDPGLVRCLDATLILLADRGLTASTVAARTAASVRADPYAVLAAGMACLEGPLHGASGSDAHALLLDVLQGRPPQALAADFLRRGERPPGVSDGPADPRAVALLSVLDRVQGTEDVLQAVSSIVRAFTNDEHQHPKVELALAALAAAAHMPLGSIDVVLSVARTAGWIAHALEEYEEQPLRWRANEMYVGEAHRDLPPGPTRDPAASRSGT